MAATTLDKVKGYWNDKSHKKFLEFNKMHTASVVFARDILKFDEFSQRRGVL